MREETKKLSAQIGFITDERVAQFVIAALEFAPDSFFIREASSSGKYHPEFAEGDEGLLRHTMAVFAIAEDLFILNKDNGFNEHDQNLIRAAIILHDMCKYGLEDSKHTLKDHPMIAYQHLNWSMQEQAFISKKDFQVIVDAIASHMGRWKATGGLDLPIPRSKLECFVHLCDYLASRKYIDKSILD